MPESLSVYLSLMLVAVLAGVVNALAGGGTLLTFPALTAVLNSPVLANCTSAVALMPGSLASVYGYRRELRQARRWAIVLLPSSLLGGAFGALAVTQFPTRVFETLVPWLILSATVIFLVQPFVSRFTHEAHRPLPLWMLIVCQFAIGLYGGYFGAGIGILMLATLALMGLTDIHEMNAVKTLQAVAINVVACIEFIRARNVEWTYALSMMAASIVGGYLGAHYGRRLGRHLVRGIVIGVGICLSFYYFVS